MRVYFLDFTRVMCRDDGKSDDENDDEERKDEKNKKLVSLLEGKSSNQG